MRNKARIRRNRRRLLLSIIIVSIFSGIVFGISLTSDSIQKNTAEAVNVEETLNMMYKANPINIAIDEVIVLYEREKAEFQLQKQREKLAEGNGKIAYLTFDDGPSPETTPKILYILDEYNVKATFFQIGYLAERHPGILKTTYDRGHSIGNHTYSHNYGYIYRSPEDFVSDLKKSEEVYKRILGPDFNTDLVRFPGGSFGKGEYIEEVKEAGYISIDWNALNGDAEGHDVPKERLVSRLQETTKDKDKLIILMHDTDQKPTTVDALGEIIEYLQSQGYIFRTLDHYVETSLVK